MTREYHITFGLDDGRIVEAEVEAVYSRDGFDDFHFCDVVITDGDESTLDEFMPEEIVDQAEEEAIRQFPHD